MLVRPDAVSNSQDDVTAGFCGVCRILAVRLVLSLNRGAEGCPRHRLDILSSPETLPHQIPFNVVSVHVFVDCIRICI